MPQKYLFLFLLSYLSSLGQEKIDGYYDSKSKFYIPSHHDYWISEFKQGFGKIAKEGYYGIIDTTGTLILPIQYDDVYITSDGLYSMLSNQKYAFDKKGNNNPNDFFGTHVNNDSFMYVPEYEQYELNYYGKQYSEGLFKMDNYRDDKGQLSLIYFDSYGKIILSNPNYTRGNAFSEGLACVYDSKLWGFINKKGQEVIALQYDHASNFKDGVANVCKNKKYGLIDTHGKTIIPFEYDYLSPVFDGLIIAKKNGKCGYLTPSGKVAIEIMYEDGNIFSNGFARVKKNGQWITIDTSNNTSDQYSYPFDEDGYRLHTIEDKTIYENKLGETLFEINSNKLSYFKNGLCKIKINNKYGFIDRLGKIIIEPIYEVAKDFEFGKALVLRNHIWYIIDKKGTELMIIYDNNNSPEMKLILGFDYRGFMNIKCDNEKYKLINTDLKEIIPCGYDQIKVLKKVIYVEKDAKVGLFDWSGNATLPLVFEQIFYYKKCYIAIQDHYINLYNTNFELLKSIYFDSIKDNIGFHSNDMMYLFRFKNKLGYINLNNFDVAMPKYDEIKFDDKAQRFQVLENGKYHYLSKL
ncbi:WG repeat-containing protein [Flavobacterium sp. SUN046]|uniref:WG repeat-containing protein n=1 Tax=Flavobacterium sp. SUN046 TaxID=3002440 RepID=UPI002DB659B2|nr:WG repeat-containing protein [Flavobacterium sp. SUN046]MEC4049104.1 WG repeat-containing protein [Flavobacterium sp. SUN046]